MELLPLLRLIWRRRLLLGGGFVVAVALAIAIGPAPPATGAVAWTRVLLDTPSSQLVTSAPKGADTLPWRASLFVHLMRADPAERQLARRLGVRPEDVAIVDPELDTPQVPAALPKAAADAAAITVAPYVLTVSMSNPYLPVISLEATAADPARAKRLAAAAVAVLESQSSTGETTYSSPVKTGGGVAKYQQFTFQQAAPVQVKRLVKAAMPIKQIGAPFFLYVLWFASVLLLPRLFRRRPRRAAPATA